MCHETNKKNDKNHGLRRGWYENGQLKYKEYYIDGDQHGKSEGWYENGQLMYIDTFIYGEKFGAQVEWAEDGRVRYKVFIDAY
jgi:antitoxin component YwqK of YwqJK toxin-antitoxin module